MATIHFSNGTSVNFNGTPTEQDIQAVAQQIGVSSSTPPPAPAKKPLTIGGAVKAVGDFFTGSEQGLGKNVADIAGAGGAQADASRASQIDSDYLHTLVTLRRKAVAEGNEAKAQHFDTLIHSYEPKGYQAPDLPSTGEVGMNLAGTAADVLSAGTYGAAKTAGMKTGELAIKGAPTVASLALKGANAGVQVAKDAGVSIAENSAKKQASKVVDMLAPAAEDLTKNERKAAIAAGRQTILNTATGGTKVGFTATPEIERAAKILTDPKKWANPLSLKDAPNVVYAKAHAAISTLGAKAEQYLASNLVKITNGEDHALFQGLRAAAEKSSTETELKAYDEQVKLFQKQLLGRPGGYTTANYYKALKEWEQNIASKLPRGKEALLDPTGIASAKIQAAADIRKAVRDLIGSKHPEFKEKMHDIAALYEARDAALVKAAGTKTASFLKKHPKTAKVVGAGLTAAGGAAGYAAYKALTD